MQFYEEIQNYSHLIIDIRNHMGGHYFHFADVVMSPLIESAVHATYYQFFTEGEHRAWQMANVDALWDEFYEMGWRTMEVTNYEASVFVSENNMIYFNESDLGYLSYATRFRYTIHPSYTNFPFRGKVWLLIDGAQSAGVGAAIYAETSGFATTVGRPTGGVTHAERTYLRLPNSGVYVHVDVGYIVDANGRSVVEFGWPPQIPSRPGLDALQTVLALIQEGYGQ
ncbi:MAG: S41 family peptidase [Defluviitaleaceae bacterium]|nr:S41 family peptidase [Defluviitaleaceae bacterium]